MTGQDHHYYASLVADAEERYLPLVQQAKESIAGLGLGSEYYEMYSTAFALVEVIRNYDPIVACESLEGLPNALDNAEILAQFYGPEYVDRAAVAFSFMLHDIGKIGLPEALRIKSHLGNKGWTATDRIVMTTFHVLMGGEIVRSAGFGEAIYRPIEESHGKQDNPAGLSPVLSMSELHTRNCIADEDYDDAMTHRSNSANVGMDIITKLNRIRGHIHRLCSDYEQGAFEVAERLFWRSVERKIARGQLPPDIYRSLAT